MCTVVMYCGLSVCVCAWFHLCEAASWHAWVCVCSLPLRTPSCSLNSQEDIHIMSAAFACTSSLAGCICITVCIHATITITTSHFFLVTHLLHAHTFTQTRTCTHTNKQHQQRHHIPHPTGGLQYRCCHCCSRPQQHRMRVVFEGLQTSPCEAAFPPQTFFPKRAPLTPVFLYIYIYARYSVACVCVSLSSVCVCVCVCVCV